MNFFFFLVLSLICTSIKCLQLPDPKFVADVSLYFNRLGIIYHLPPTAKSDVLRYHKTISKFRYTKILDFTIKIMKSFTFPTKTKDSLVYEYILGIGLLLGAEFMLGLGLRTIILQGSWLHSNPKFSVLTLRLASEPNLLI